PCSAVSRLWQGSLPTGSSFMLLPSAEKATCHLCSGGWAPQTLSTCSGRSMISVPRTTLPLGRYWASRRKFGPIVQPFAVIVKALSGGRWACVAFSSVQVPLNLAGGGGGATTCALTVSVATWLSAVTARTVKVWRPGLRKV